MRSSRDCSTGSTSSVSPFTFLTRTRAPFGIVCPARAAARHNSPCTRTIPVRPTLRRRRPHRFGDFAHFADQFFLARRAFQVRDRSTSRIRIITITANGIATPSAVHKLTPMPGQRRPNQKHRAQHHRHHAAHAQHSMRRKFRFENEQRECHGDQQQSREVHRQQVHRKERQHQRDPADHTRCEHSGMSELGVEPQHAQISRIKNTSGCTMRDQEFLPRPSFPPARPRDAQTGAALLSHRSA